jgi:hypothetical protein
VIDCVNSASGGVSQAYQTCRRHWRDRMAPGFRDHPPARSQERRLPTAPYRRIHRMPRLQFAPPTTLRQANRHDSIPVRNQSPIRTSIANRFSSSAIISAPPFPHEFASFTDTTSNNCPRLITLFENHKIIIDFDFIRTLESPTTTYVSLFTLHTHHRRHCSGRPAEKSLMPSRGGTSFCFLFQN